MEGIEISHSENVDITQSHLLTLDEATLADCNAVVPTEHPLQPCIPLEQKIHWLTGHCLVSGEPWLIPVGMLSMDFTLPAEQSRAPRQFRSTSNGLASGRTHVEACVSGLLEVVERHSITQNNMLRRNLTRIELGHSCPNRLERVLDQISVHDIEVAIYDATEVPGLHTIEAYLSSPSQVIPPVHGTGCSLDLEVAILRAVLEANQASTLLLSGSRDDITKSTYLISADAVKIYNTYQRKTKSTRLLERSDFSQIDMTPQEELSFVLRQLHGYVNREILLYTYTPPEFPVSVCKVFVPTLEGYFTSGYRPQRESAILADLTDVDSGLHLAAGGRI